MNSNFNNLVFIDSFTPGLETINNRTSERNWAIGVGSFIILGLVAVIIIQKYSTEKNQPDKEAPEVKNTVPQQVFGVYRHPN